MYLPKSASKARLREAQTSRDNRAEIVRALHLGEVTRRDLFRMGIFTVTGALALKNGLSPFARSAFAAIPVGTPPSPMFGAQRFTQAFQRMNLQTGHRLTHQNVGGKMEACFPAAMAQLNGKATSWHEEFTASSGASYYNPVTNRGPLEGRPPGPYFAHQRWDEYLPQVGYVSALGQIAPNMRFHPNMPAQGPNAVWSYNTVAAGTNPYTTRGTLPAPLLKIRYGEPVLHRIYNALPTDRALNGGFGRNETAVHNHNAHNGSGSDGAQNAHFFPGQFYDYHWGTCLARSDTINTAATDLRASGIDDNGMPVPIAGDFRELQGTLWFHDHRFFFTAENVYKGNMGMLNYYSGPDRGNEEIEDGINLRLPSGRLLPWGNLDFDVNLVVSDFATDPHGQLFFDIFDTDGFLGDNLLVNQTWAPSMDVMPRKYRFRVLNACMSRFIKLSLVNQSGVSVPVQVVGNDGNLLVNPVSVTALDTQGVAERFDVIVDFSRFRVGDKLMLVNHLEHNDGRGPKGVVSIADALKGKSNDPAVGPIMQFVIANSVPSVDVPGYTYTLANMGANLPRVPLVLTQQIPVVTPTRSRTIEFTRGGGGNDGCLPDCDERENFPWTVKVNGQDAHYLNANRISLVFPQPGDIEHITLKNGGGGWDHPIHLHFEEGVTLSRSTGALAATERLARKDVWRLGPGASVTFQVQFGEFGGAYVSHCHNTVHEDFAMLLRYQLLKTDNGTGDPFVGVSQTPNPTPDGVEWLTPEILPEGDPRINALRSASNR
ncbi:MULTISPECIES: multicopper oxidase domain-containing protein [Rhodomicrobium]|uniref:multicopper oxidase family protein n=1 Tax=Rhodomicrobium TaxID=1068 RepID=UPI000B4ABCAB|nr:MULTISPECIES: multicopper oxidase domain-containing protein [Rhodomicrobium]